MAWRDENDFFFAFFYYACTWILAFEINKLRIERVNVEITRDRIETIEISRRSFLSDLEGEKKRLEDWECSWSYSICPS